MPHPKFVPDNNRVSNCFCTDLCLLPEIQCKLKSLEKYSKQYLVSRTLHSINLIDVRKNHVYCLCESRNSMQRSEKLCIIP